MKPRSLRIKNIGPYADESINLDAIPGDLIAICGLNGEGKTMFMESIFAGMYRNFPSRDAGIYRYCTDRHAGIEFEFEVGGKVYVSYLNFDSKTRKMETVLACDKLPLNDGLTGTFDEQIQKILGYEAQALASSYGAQNKKGNFVELEKAKRKDLFIAMIGAASLQAISIEAKGEADALEPSKEKLVGQLEAFKATADKPIPDSSKTEELIRQESLTLTDLQSRIDELNKCIVLDDSRISRIPSLESEKLVHSQAVVELVEKSNALKTNLGELSALLVTIPGMQEEMKMASSNEATLWQSIISLREKCTRLPELQRLSLEIKTKVTSLEDSREVIVKSIREQSLLAEGLSAMREKSADLVRLRSEESEASSQLRRLNSELLSLTQLEVEHSKALGVLNKKMDKIKASENATQLILNAARKGEGFLKEVPCQGQGVYAECKFLKDAIESASKIDELTATIDNLKISSLGVQQEIDAIPKDDPQAKSKISVEITRLNSLVTGLKGTISEYEKSTQKLQDAESASGKLSMLKESLANADQSLESARNESSTAAAAVTEVEGHKKKLSTLETEFEEVRKVIASLNERLKNAEGCEDKLARVRDDVERNNADIISKQMRVSAIDSELAELATLKTTYEDNLKKFSDLDAAKVDLVKRIKDLNYQVARDQEEAESIRRAIESVKDVEAQLYDKNYRIACYRRVATDFGPMAIQSFEIDSAGPEVSRIANELLFNCFGPRFSIRFVTQEPLAKGPGFKDEFDVSVYDQRHDRWVSIDDLSGGEQVIVTEALALSIALYNREKNGVIWETLFRDEVSGALDDNHAPQYIKMLRSAREMGHFKRVFFISHQGRMKEMADSRIIVSNGKLSVES